MRKPRNYDAELKALTARAAQLKTRKVQQLGELIVATGADALPMDELAGALIAAIAEKNSATKEGWCKAGTRFFQRTRRTAGGAAASGASAAPDSSGTLPLAGGKSAT
jgi:DNA-binding protein H-NS